jgi:hypothetical protein
MAGGHRLFVRRRDGRIEVRLSDSGRAIAREAFGHVVAAERDPDHEWGATLTAPVDPTRDEDDPVTTLKRQQETATNAELAVASLREEFLTDQEAWAWLCTLQVALRATAVSRGLLTDDKLAAADRDVLAEVQTLQQFLFDLAACF